MRVLGLPSLYKQGPGLIDGMGRETKQFGSRPMIVCDAAVRGIFEDRLGVSLVNAGMKPYFETFSGQTSPRELERLAHLAVNRECDFVIGLGGGKALDSAKVVKKETGIPVVIVPTIASNDGAASRLAITYSEEGRFIGPVRTENNPDAVLVDSQVIVNAPPRFLISGIGDALSTAFEAEQCLDSGAENFFGARPTRTAVILARSCYSVVREAALPAMASVRKGVITDAVEELIEAVVLLSGIGFEGCGVAAAHAISQGFSLIDDLHGNLHGEEVGAALLSQLVLENRSMDFLRELMDFYRRIGIPHSLACLGLNNPSPEQYRRIAEFACRENSRIFNMAVKAEAEDVQSALEEVERLAGEF